MNWFDVNNKNYGYAKRNRVLLNKLRNDLDFRFVYVSNEKIISYTIKRESINSLLFSEFLFGKITSRYQNRVLLMDNASTHKTNIVKDS